MRVQEIAPPAREPLLRRMVKAVAPSRPITPDGQDDHSLARALRAAAVQLYASTGRGGLVPSLDYSDRRMRNAPQAIRRNPALFGPLWSTAFRIGALPVKVWTIDAASKDREESLTHDAYRILRRPNRLLTRNLLFSGTVAGMLAHGKVGWYKQREKGKVVELWPIPGGALFPKADPAGKDLMGDFEVRPLGVPPITVKFDDLCYFRLMPDLDDWGGGMSPYTALASTGDVAAGSLSAMSEVFSTGILQRLWINLHGQELDPEARDRLRTEIDIIRGAKMGIPIFGESDETLENMGDAPNSDLLTKAWDMADAIVRATTGMPTDEDVVKFYSWVVAPIADAMEQELERSLMPEFTPDAFPEFQFREVLAGSPKDRAELWRTKILSGQATPNEARRAEGEPPMEGGDLLFLPLNVIPAASLVTGPTPKKDTTDGFGGDEGKGTLADTGVQPQAAGARPRSKYRQAMHAAWGEVRRREVAAQSTALGRQMRGALKKELKALRALVVPARSSAPVGARQGDPGLPSREELLVALDAGTEAVERLFRQFLGQAGAEAWSAAADLVGREEAGLLADTIERVLAERAAFASERFRAIRASELEGLLADAMRGSWTVRELDVALAGRWGTLADNYIDGVARTETAFGFEQAAMASWRESGITTLDFVFGGGPCTTGVCEEAGGGSPYAIGEQPGDVGYSFEGTDAPPLHPSCTCFTAPTVPEE